MKEIKLSFPYPSTSRHNLSQDIGTSLSMGLVIPVRTVEVLGGDSHRIGTSFSLISNPLVKPLLQGVNMRYCRFWVPRRIYHLAQRANNSNFDIMEAPVRHAFFSNLRFPAMKGDTAVQASNFEQSSLFDYLGLAGVESNVLTYNNGDTLPASPIYMSTSASTATYNINYFNAEPYLAYLDICRNYFSDSANGMIAWSWARSRTGFLNDPLHVYVSDLRQLDGYIDLVQNSYGQVTPFDISSREYINDPSTFSTFELPSTAAFLSGKPISVGNSSFDAWFQIARFGLCVPLNRPDRLSRLFDTKPLTSQNATIAPSEISISNLSFLSKMQRYLTRRFFGGSRFTDVMYSVLGQKVPHVDSPVLLDVFDYELGSELVASTNATADQNPGVLGGFFSAAGRLTTGRGGFKRKYRFNEPGYLVDLVYIMPRLFRTAFVPDYYFISAGANPAKDTPMLQANFVPDFNGIGWQQPALNSAYVAINFASDGSIGTSTSRVQGFSCEPSWQQYRTLPDVCHGAMNPLRLTPGASTYVGFGSLSSTSTINSPLFTFNDRMSPYNVTYGFTNASSVVDNSNVSRALLARTMYTDFNQLNRIFGTDDLVVDNIFAVFRYAHQAKRQVTKRFTLTFA